MESNRDRVIRAANAARAAADGLPDLERHQSYDKAFLRLLTKGLAEIEILQAHLSNRTTFPEILAGGFLKTLKTLQQGMQELRSNYPTTEVEGTGYWIDLVSSYEQHIRVNVPDQLAAQAVAAMDRYTLHVTTLMYVAFQGSAAFLQHLLILD